MIIEVKETIHPFLLEGDPNRKLTRNRHPDSISYKYLKKDRSGQWITGYTPGFYDEEDEDALKEELEFFKKSRNKKFDLLDPNDPFLSLFKVHLSLPDNKLPVYDDQDPEDLFTIRTAIALGYIAPKKDMIGVGKYIDTTYYFEAREIEVKKNKEIGKLRIAVGSILSKYEESRAWLIVQAFLLKMNVLPTTENDTLFSYIVKHIEEAKTTKELEALKKQFSRSNAETEIVFIVKKSTELKQLKYNDMTLEYILESESGATSLGKTIPDVEAFLANPVNRNVYVELRKLIYAKYKIK